MTAKQSTSYPLRLPNGIKEAVAQYAAQEGISMNQFIALAVAEKLSALDTAEFFRVRAARANMDAFWEIMSRPGGAPPREGDVLPEGYTPLPRSTQS